MLSGLFICIKNSAALHHLLTTAAAKKLKNMGFSP